MGSSPAASIASLRRPSARGIPVVCTAVTVGDDDPICAICCCCAWTVDGQDDSMAMEIMRDKTRAIGGGIVLAEADAVGRDVRE